MNIPLKEDNTLTIHLISFDRPTETSESFYFLEMSTLQATTLLPQDKKIHSVKIFSYTSDNKYLDDQTIAGFKTIGAFNSFFQDNQEYYIADCDIKLENDLLISSHDDGEVTIQLRPDKDDHHLIYRIFEKFNLNESLLENLRSKPSYFLAVDQHSNLVAEYKSFDDYLEKGSTAK